MDKKDNSYSLSAAYDKNGVLSDVQLRTSGREFMLLGKYAYKRVENDLKRLEELGAQRLLVLVGAGTPGYLAYVRSFWNGPLAIIDKELSLTEFAGTDDLLEKGEFLRISDADPQTALSRITRWQLENNGLPFYALSLPAYLRLDPKYYKYILSHLEASSRYDFWAKTRYARFKQDLPRILLITSQYFLMGEIQAACRRLGVEHHFLQLPDQEIGRQEYVQELLEAVLNFKPDFVLTINHLGVDKEGVLLDLLQKMRLPLASWFVDNPHLILYLYENLKSPWTAIFTWDKDNLFTLRERGFEHLTFLPLATDSERFVSRNGSMSPDNDVAFVGNSMVYKVRSKLRDSVLTSRLKSTYREVGEHFGLSELHSVQNFLRMNKPDLWEEFAAVQDIEDRLRYETGITWEATRIYREKCIRQLLKFNPIIAGDDGWLETLSDADGWRRSSELNYYSQLPDFYPHNRINFNCTSAQMKGAVNQRVFDVPASGSFLLTDYRRQLEELFDLERETACFDCVEEIPDLVRYYLRHPGLREKIVHSARQRILSEHTYEIRLRKLIKKMREIYA